METKNKNTSQRHLSVRTMCLHIRALYNLAQPTEVIDGKRWYREARAWCAQVSHDSGVPLLNVVGALAALSPGTSWELNKRDTLNLIDAFTFSDASPFDITVSTYRANLKKAIDILNNCEGWDDVFETLQGKTGYKTARFFACIYKPNNEEYVCIDRHAYKAAQNIVDGGEIGITWKRYRETQQAYIRVAKSLKLKPCELQGIVWVVYKRINNR